MSILLTLAALTAPADPDNGARKRLQEAMTAFQAKDCPRTLKLLDPLLKPSKAEALGSEVGSAILVIAASCAFAGDQTERGYDLAERATRAGTDEPTMWAIRIERDLFAKKYDAAVMTVEELGNGRAGTLSKIGARTFGQLNAGLIAANETALRRRLLKVLAESYAPDRAEGSGEEFRVQYARILMTEGDTAAAQAIVQGIEEPRLLRELMVDPVLRAALPANFDIRAATERRLADQQAYAATRPDELGALLDTTALLRQLGRPEEAVKLLESVRAKVAAGSFDDIADQRSWWWDSLARSQEMLGQVDAAAASLRGAIPTGEGGGKNVSQVINLMQLLADHGRGPEALAVPAAAGGLGLISPYGELQLRQARVCAYALTGVRAEAEADIAYIRTNKTIDPDGYVDVLLCTGNLDAAAAELIAQLGQPEQRTELLLRASSYAKPPVDVPPSPTERAFRSVIARPAVQAALREAGGVRAFNVQRTRY